MEEPMRDQPNEPQPREPRFPPERILIEVVARSLQSIVNALKSYGKTKYPSKDSAVDEETFPQ